MAVSNPSFEVGSGGVATSWTLAVTATVHQIASYVQEDASYLSWEDFDNNWSATPWLSAHTSTPLAEYSSDMVVPKYHEDFEETWGNTPYLTEIATSAAALYGTPPTDTFDTFLWTAHVTSFTPGMLEAAVWDTTNDFDSFETWAVYKDSFDPGDVSANYWNTFGSSLTYESFESAYHSRSVVGDAATNKLLSSGHGFPDTLKVRLEVTEGTLPEPLNTVTDYYVRDSALNDFRLTLTPSGSLIDLTTSSVGTQTVLPSTDDVWTQFLNL